MIVVGMLMTEGSEMNNNNKKGLFHLFTLIYI